MEEKPLTVSRRLVGSAPWVEDRPMNRQIQDLFARLQFRVRFVSEISRRIQPRKALKMGVLSRISQGESRKGDFSRFLDAGLGQRRR